MAKPITQKDLVDLIVNEIPDRIIHTGLTDSEMTHIAVEILKVTDYAIQGQMATMHEYDGFMLDSDLLGKKLPEHKRLDRAVDTGIQAARFRPKPIVTETKAATTKKGTTVIRPITVIREVDELPLEVP